MNVYHMQNHYMQINECISHAKSLHAN